MTNVYRSRDTFQFFNHCGGGVGIGVECLWGCKARQTGFSKFNIIRVDHGGRNEYGHHVHDMEEKNSKQTMAQPNLPCQRRYGMSKVPSLLFDLETDDCGCTHQDKTEVKDHIHHLLLAKTRYELSLRESALQVLNGREEDLSYLAFQLEKQGYNVKVRNALGASSGSRCLSELRHSFLVHTSEDGTGYIIDPKFKLQFQVANSTQQYQELSDVLPSVYIASEESLVRLVHYMCTQMEISFREMGQTMPPWRSCSALLSMWKPRRLSDATPHNFELINNQNETDSVSSGDNPYLKDVVESQKERLLFQKESIKSKVANGACKNERSILSEVLQDKDDQLNPLCTTYSFYEISKTHVCNRVHAFGSKDVTLNTAEAERSCLSSLLEKCK